MPTNSFSLHYPVAQYIAYREHHDTRPKKADGSREWDGPAYKAWLDGYRDHSSKLEDAVTSFLISKANVAPLAAIAFTKDRGHQWSDSWNRFAGGIRDAREFKCVTSSLAATLRTSVGRIAAESPDFAADYLDLCLAADTGDFHWFEIDTRRACRATGLTLYVEIKGWAPVLGVMDHKNKSHLFTMLTSDLAPPQVNHHVINSPSGELLIADWFRIDAFTESIKNDDSDFDINNDAGKLSQTECYAQQHGFMSVCVGNTSPRLIEMDGQVVVATLTESERGLQGRDAGYVCTDLWWATAIDRQVLTDILARTMPREAAVSTVAEYLDPKQNNIVTTLKVRPGQLHVYHTSKPIAMSGFQSPAVNTTGVDQLYAVISETELNWAPKNSVAQARRPRMR